jgi:hypothetical protein
MPVSIWINICPNTKISTPEHELQNRKSEFFSTYGNNFGIRFNEGIISRLDDIPIKFLT